MWSRRRYVPNINQEVSRESGFRVSITPPYPIFDLGEFINVIKPKGYLFASRDI